MTLLVHLVAFVVGLVLGSSVVYVAVPLGPSRGVVTAREAVAVALIGLVLSELLAVVVGPGSVVAWLAGALGWIGVVGRLCPVTRLTAAAVGALGWATSTAVLGLLALL
jgi:uncharacterized membrane protein YciS (DUF1049 family)